MIPPSLVTRRRRPAVGSATLLLLTTSLACSGGATPGLIRVAAGGTARSSDGKVSVVVPPGALTADAVITVKPIAVDAWSAEVRGDDPIGPVYALEPSGISFAKPVTVTFKLSAADLGVAGSAPQLPMPFMVTRGTGRLPTVLPDGTTTLSSVDNSVTISATTMHLSHYYMHHGYFLVQMYPDEVRKRLKDPPWSTDVRFTVHKTELGSNDYLFRDKEYSFKEDFRVSAMRYTAGGQVGARAPIYHGPFVISTGQTKHLDDPAPTYACLGPGPGTFSVEFAQQQQVGGASQEYQVFWRYVLSGNAKCVDEEPPKSEGPGAALNHPPVLKLIRATFERPVTTYTGGATDPDGDELTYRWEITNRCGVFSFANEIASWSHPDGKAKGQCPKEDVHPAIITEIVDDGYVTCKAYYEEGSAPGIGHSKPICGVTGE